jgi:hypothetical protein
LLVATLTPKLTSQAGTPNPITSGRLSTNIGCRACFAGGQARFLLQNSINTQAWPRYFPSLPMYTGRQYPSEAGFQEDQVDRSSDRGTRGGRNQRFGHLRADGGRHEL